MKKAQTDNVDENLERLLGLAGPRPEPSSALAREVYDEVHQVWTAQARRRIRLRRSLQTAVAASVVAMLAVSLWSLTRDEPVNAAMVAQLDRTAGQLEAYTSEAWRPVGAGDALLSDTRVRTGALDRAGLVLANGISLRLDHETLLHLETPQRVVLSRGRIYVDTAASNTRHASVEVVTPAGVVRDIGTQFEVYVDPLHTRVRVREGEVIVDTAIEEFVAQHGESLTVGSNGLIDRSAVASDDMLWNWIHAVTPRFETDGRRVYELIEWVARETGREVRYSDALVRNAAARTRIRGSITGRTPDDTLELALATTRFNYQIENTVLSIEKRR